MNRFRTFLAPRAAALEILLGTLLVTVGIAMVFSLGAALIVLGVMMTAGAIWPLWRRR